MPVQLVRNDITKIHCDAIVNAANSSLLGGGGVDGAIHRAAGRELLKECMTLGGCKTGQAKVTGGYKLPCRYVIHTVGPKWRGGNDGERQLLESCYRESLRLAEEKGCESVAFPLISSGICGYPKDQALRVAMDVISEFVMEHDMLVYLVMFDKASCQIGEKLFSDIQAYIDDHYVELHLDENYEMMREAQESQLFEMEDEEPCVMEPQKAMWQEDEEAWQALSSGVREEKTLASRFRWPRRRRDADEEPFGAARSCPVKWQKDEEPIAMPFAEESVTVPNGENPIAMASAMEPTMMPYAAAAPSLEELVNQVDESFSQMLLRKIDEKEMTDAQCYKKANIDRKLFSKIRKDVHYKPSKTTAIAFAIALELPLEETKDMLMKAGFALSHSNKFDIIIEYFIQHKNYNIFEINEALFTFDQSLLG